MQLQTGQTILFTGDSITDCGRSRPLGDVWGLGDGYVSLVHSALSAWYPERRVRVLNTGISGNRVSDLAARWQADVLDHHADWLSVLIGINDVWRQFDRVTDADQIDLAQYATTYRQLLDASRPQLSGGLLLMTPYFIEAHTQDPMRALMDEYGAVVKQLAHDYEATLIDLQAAFDGYLHHQPTQTLGADRIHPKQAGHMIIAKAVLSALGFDWVR